MKKLFAASIFVGGVIGIGLLALSPPILMFMAVVLGVSFALYKFQPGITFVTLIKKLLIALTLAAIITAAILGIAALFLSITITAGLCIGLGAFLGAIAYLHKENLGGIATPWTVAGFGMILGCLAITLASTVLFSTFLPLTIAAVGFGIGCLFVGFNQAISVKQDRTSATWSGLGNLGDADRNRGFVGILTGALVSSLVVGSLLYFGVISIAILPAIMIIASSIAGCYIADQIFTNKTRGSEGEVLNLDAAANRETSYLCLGATAVINLGSRCVNGISDTLNSLIDAANPPAP
jgi:hypothetical protein